MPPTERLKYGFIMALVALTAARGQAEVGHPAFEVLPAPMGGGQLVGTDVSVRPDGIVFIATMGGIVRYDKERWTLIEHPDRLPAQAVAAGTAGMVFAGFRNDFGVLSRNTENTLTFRSLRRALASSALLGNCRQIFTTETDVYFGFETGVVTSSLDIERHQFAFYPVGEGLSCMSYSWVRGELIAALNHGGLHRLSDGQFVPLVADAKKRQPGHNDGFMIGCCEHDSGAILTTTYRNGMALIRSGQYEPFRTEIAEFAQRVGTKGVTRLGDDQYVLCTEDGVAFFNGKGEITDRLGPLDGEGLRTCTGRAVLGSERSLWVPTIGKGPVARIDLTSSLRSFGFKDGELFWSARLQDDLYLSASKSVYRLVPQAGKHGFSYRLESIVEGISQSWGSLKVGDQLLAATTRGLYVIDSAGRVDRVASTYLTDGTVLPDGETVLFGSINQGIQRFRRSGKKWKWLGRVDASPRTQCFQPVLNASGETLWFVAMNDKGQMSPCCLPLGAIDSQPTQESQAVWFDESTNESRNRLCLWNDHIVFNSSDGLLRYDSAEKRFVELADLPMACPYNLTNPMGPVTTDVSGNLWVATRDGLILRLTTEGKIDCPVSLGKGRFLKRFISTSEQLWFLTTNYEVVIVPQDLPQAENPQRVLITAVRADGVERKNSWPINEPLTIPFASTPITFEYTTPSNRRLQNKAYQFRLNGLDEQWSPWTDSSFQSYRALPAGDYRFEVRARGRNFKLTPPVGFDFTVTPPWYKSSAAMFGYVLLALGLTFGSIQWRNLRAKKQVEKLELTVSQRTGDLEASREKYRNLVEGLEVNYVFFTSDREGRLTYVSPSVENVLGFKPEELLGHSWCDLAHRVHPGEVHAGDSQPGDPELGPVCTQTDRESSSQTYEVSFQHADGSSRQFEITQFAANSSPADVQQRECIAKDINDLKIAQQHLEEARATLEQKVLQRTKQLSRINEELVQQIDARRKIERDLQRSERNYRSIVEDQTEMILRFTASGTITFANQAFCDRYEITPQEAIGRNCFESIHPDYREAAIQKVLSTTREQPMAATMFRVLRPNGTEDWAEWNGRALYDEEGNHHGYQAVGRIVTDLVEAEQKLRESELRYRSIVEDQTELIVRFDANGIIEFANGAYMRANGLTPETAVGASIFDSMPEDEHPRIIAKMQGATQENPAQSDRIRVQHDDGTVEWEDWHGRGLYDAEGNFLCYQAVGRNVTKLLAAEERLREKEEHLRHVSRLSNLGEMVAGITHEIRQPLSSISNFAFAAGKTLESETSQATPKLRHWNQQIVTQVTRADAIIRRLRGFARRSDAEPESVSINTIISDSLVMLKFELKRARVHSTVELSDQVPLIMLERIQIEQVMVNLIRNACDAMQATEPEYRVIITRTEVVGDEIVVSVQDNGPGLPQDQLELVFHPFNTSKAAGLGLGLPISRSIIEECGGRIWAEEAKPGLLVKFALPIV